MKRWSKAYIDWLSIVKKKQQKTVWMVVKKTAQDFKHWIGDIEIKQVWNIKYKESILKEDIICDNAIIGSLAWRKMP